MLDLLNWLTGWRLNLAVATGELVLPAGTTAADLRWSWHPSGLPWWDKGREVAGDVAAIAAGLDTETAVIRRRTGRSLRDVVQERADEIRVKEAAGIVTAADPDARGLSGVLASALAVIAREDRGDETPPTPRHSGGRSPRRPRTMNTRDLPPAVATQAEFEAAADAVAAIDRREAARAEVVAGPNPRPPPSPPPIRSATPGSRSPTPSPAAGCWNGCGATPRPTPTAGWPGRRPSAPPPPR